MPTFILNDEKVTNIYGFRIPNKSVDLARFKANPVMLAEHINGLSGVIGRWVNIRIDGSQLLADTEFDIADEDAKKIEGKVERGFVKGCSMGVLPFEFGRAIDGVPETLACELIEASICAIPANSGALIKLFNESGQLLTADDIKLSIAALSTDKTFLNQNQMKQIQLSIIALAALGFTQQITENDGPTLSAAIESLKAGLEAKTLELSALKDKYKALSTAQSKALIDLAIQEGRITEADRAEYEELAESNLSIAAKAIARIPAKTDLSSKLSNTTAGAAGQPKTQEDFQKLSLTEQMAFKTNHAEAYKSLFA